MVKRLSTIWETWVRSLGWEDSLEKEMATHSSTLAQKIPWTEEPGAGYCPWGRKESDMTEQLHIHTAMEPEMKECIALHPVPDANCLTVSHCAHCWLDPGQARCEQRGWKET